VLNLPERGLHPPALRSLKVSVLAA